MSAPMDRRKEPRRSRDSGVLLVTCGPRPIIIQGRLLDSSTHGFRASHSSSVLQSGQEVAFQYDGAAGQAKVIWNRFLNGCWESGFFLTG